MACAFHLDKLKYITSMKKFLSNWMTILLVAIVNVGLVSCGDDDKDSDSTTFYAVLKTPSGTRLNGGVYVFPNASDYDPESFKEGEVRGKATISHKDGTIVNSYSYVMCSTEELGVWHHYDREPSYDPWLHSCNPGTYYMIATRTGWSWNYAWMSKTVTIKANQGNLEEFVFTTINGGYQHEEMHYGKAIEHSHETRQTARLDSQP
jgi:hypothetical protein